MATNIIAREIEKHEYPLLEDFLYHAVFQPPGEPLIPREVIFEPEVFVYIKDFGTGAGDCGVVAERCGKNIIRKKSRLASQINCSATFLPQNGLAARCISNNRRRWPNINAQKMHDISSALIMGAAWTRIIPGFGHIDANTPELATSVLPEFRGQGIGTLMMTRLFELLRQRGYRQTSLAVQQRNAAARFYTHLGYKTIRENDEEFIMVKDL